MTGHQRERCLPPSGHPQDPRRRLSRDFGRLSGSILSLQQLGRARGCIKHPSVV